MARTRTVTVQVAQRLGFKHSFSSAEAIFGETADLEHGDHPRAVRLEIFKRLSRDASTAVRRIRDLEDRPADNKDHRG